MVKNGGNLQCRIPDVLQLVMVYFQPSSQEPYQNVRVFDHAVTGWIFPTGFERPLPQTPCWDHCFSSFRPAVCVGTVMGSTK